MRFGYDGAPFSGWARQPGLRTVESELRGGLIRRGVLTTDSAASLGVASRTDRGVSARANAFVCSSDLTGPNLLRALNGISPDIFCTAATPVSEEFRVRNAESRTYRFFEAAGALDLVAWNRAAQVLVGTIDVRSFGRSLPLDLPVWRTVDLVSVRRSSRGAIVEIRARSFVWGMVRKMVGALRDHGAGHLSLEQLERAVCGESRLTLPMAEPEPLVLWEVAYPLAWAYSWSGPNRRQAARARTVRNGCLARSQVLRALSSLGSDSEDPPRSPGALGG